MKFRGPALLAAGVGGLYFASSAPANARRPIQLGSVAALVLGVLWSFDDLSSAGGLFASLEDLISGPGAGQREDIHTRTQKGIELAGPGTSTTPGDGLPPPFFDFEKGTSPSERMPFVIPTTVSFLDPIDGGTLELSFWQRTYPLTVEVQNNSVEILSGVLSLNVLQKFPVADDETRSVLGRQLSIGPGRAARVTFDVPFARGSILDAVSYVHAGLLLDGRNIGFADFDLR